MAKTDKVVVYVLIIVAVLLANSMGYINIPGMQSASGADVAKGDVDTGTGTLCLHDGSTMTIGPADYRYVPAESVTNEYHKIFMDGIDRGLKADGTTMSVSTPTRIGGTDGSAVEIYYALNSTDFYAAKQAFSVPCISSFSSGARPDSDAYKLIRNATDATISTAVFSDDEGLKMDDNNDGNNESLAASDACDLRYKVTFPSKKGYSPYGKIYLTVLYNTTIIKASTLDVTSSDTTVTKGATTPSHRVTASSATGKAFKTFTFPGVEGASTSVLNFNIHIDSKAVDPTFPGANTSIFLDDEDWFLNNETGGMSFGPSDTDDNDVGDTSTIENVIPLS